jgi:hypothetical protein
VLTKAAGPLNAIEPSSWKKKLIKERTEWRIEKEGKKKIIGEKMKEKFGKG